MGCYIPTTKTDTLHVKVGFVGTGQMTSGSAAVYAGFPATAWDVSPGFRIGDVGAPVTVIGAGADAPVVPVFGPPGKMLVTTLSSFSDAGHGVLANAAQNDTEDGASNLAIYRDVTCVAGSISINWALSSIASPTAKFTVRSLDGRVPVAAGMPVLVMDDTLGAYWGGSIDAVNVVQNPGSDEVNFECSCVSWSYLLTKRFVSLYILTGGVYPEQAADATIKDLIYNYCNSEGLTVGTITGAPTLAAQTLTGKSLADALTALASSASNVADALWQWWIDAYRVIHFEEVSSEMTPWGIDESSGTDSNILVGVHVNITREKLANRCYLEITNCLQPITVAAYNGDGSNRTFSMQCPIGAKPELDINGVSVSSADIGLKPDSSDTHSFKWYWQPKSNSIEQDSTLTATPLAKTDRLTVTYQPLQVQHFLGDDVDSFNARSAVEGGTGIWEMSVTISDEIIPATEGDARALEIAKSLSSVPSALDFSTYKPGLLVGKVLPVKLGSIGVSTETDFLIDQVDFTTDENYQMWKIHAVNGSLIGDWRTAFAGLFGKTGLGGGINAASDKAPIVPGALTFTPAFFQYGVLSVENVAVASSSHLTGIDFYLISIDELLSDPDTGCWWSVGVVDGSTDPVIITPTKNANCTVPEETLDAHVGDWVLFNDTGHFEWGQIYLISGGQWTIQRHWPGTPDGEATFESAMHSHPDKTKLFICPQAGRRFILGALAAGYDESQVPSRFDMPLPASVVGSIVAAPFNGSAYGDWVVCNLATATLPGLRTCIGLDIPIQVQGELEAAVGIRLAVSLALPYDMPFRVASAYVELAPTGADLITKVKHSIDKGSNWTDLATLTIAAGTKQSWPDISPPQDRQEPYSGAWPYTILLGGDFLNVSVEQVGSTVKGSNLTVRVSA